MSAGSIKVSVIMPVYNTSAYLPATLDAVLAQTLTDIEVICVDDGSADSSLDILKSYAQKDSRVRVYTQENQYAGAARNAGLNEATGDYVIFWDSDDLFHPDALLHMYDAIVRDDADICVCGGCWYIEDRDWLLPCQGYLNMNRVPGTKRPFSREDIPDTILNFSGTSAWNKLYRREYIENQGLMFPPYRTYEDVCFSILSIALAERITVVDEQLFYYRRGRNGSLVDTISNNPIDPGLCWMDIYSVLSDRGIMPKRSFDNMCVSSLAYAIRHYTDFKSMKQLFLFLKETVFPVLWITEQEGDYYYVDWYNEFIRRVWEDRPEDFMVFMTLLSFAESTDFDYRRKKALLDREDYKNRLIDQRDRNTDLKERNKDLRDRYIDLRDRYNSLLSVRIKRFFERLFGGKHDEGAGDDDFDEA